MSTVTHGADPAELRVLGTRMLSQCAAIDEILTVGSLVQSTSWVGPAREAFMSQWETSFRTVLTNLSASFEVAGKECHIRAGNLEVAMGGVAGGAAGAGPTAQYAV